MPGTAATRAKIKSLCEARAIEIITSMRYLVASSPDKLITAEEELRSGQVTDASLILVPYEVSEPMRERVGRGAWSHRVTLTYSFDPQVFRVMRTLTKKEYLEAFPRRDIRPQATAGYLYELHTD